MSRSLVWKKDGRLSKAVSLLVALVLAFGLTPAAAFTSAQTAYADDATTYNAKALSVTEATSFSVGKTYVFTDDNGEHAMKAEVKSGNDVAMISVEAKVAENVVTFTSAEESLACQWVVEASSKLKGSYGYLSFDDNEGYQCDLELNNSSNGASTGFSLDAGSYGKGLRLGNKSTSSNTYYLNYDSTANSFVVKNTGVTKNFRAWEVTGEAPAASGDGSSVTAVDSDKLQVEKASYLENGCLYVIADGATAYAMKNESDDNNQVLQDAKLAAASISGTSGTMTFNSAADSTACQWACSSDFMGSALYSPAANSDNKWFTYYDDTTYGGCLKLSAGKSYFTAEGGLFQVETGGSPVYIGYNGISKFHASTSTPGDDAVSLWKVTGAASSSGSKYAITKGTTENGSFEVATEAAEGDTVAITATPTEGYQVKAVTVTKSSGGAVDVSSDDGYSFVMPGEAVTVAVEFEQIPATPALAVSLAAGRHQGSGQTEYEKLAGQSVELHAQIQSLKLGDTALITNGADMYATGYTQNDFTNFKVHWYEGSVDSSNLKRDDPLDWNDQSNKPKWGTDFTYQLSGLTVGAHKVYAVATWEHEGYTSATSEPLEFTITVKPSYSVTLGTVNSEEGTVELGGTTDGKAGENDEITIKATPKDGYAVDSISVKTANSTDVTVNDNKFTMPAADVTVTVTFKAVAPVTYDIAIADYNTTAGEVSISGATDNKAAAGAEITVTATPKDGYAVDDIAVRWTGGDTEVGVNNGAFTMPASGVTITVTFVQRITLTANDLGYFDDKYAWTGDIIKIAPRYKKPNSGQVKLVEGTDYTIDIKQGGQDATFKDRGVYQVTLTGLGRYEGTVTKDISIVDYFTVYLKKGTAEPEVVKIYTAGEFAGLKSTSSDPISALFWKDNKWNVVTAATYVTLADLLEDASIANCWTTGAKISFVGGTEVYTYDQIQAMSNFYPAAQEGVSAISDDPELETRPMEFVFALSGNAAATDEKNNAKAIEKTNVDNAKKGEGTAPRTVFGITEEDYKNPDNPVNSVAGHRLWSNETSITIIQPVDTSEATVTATAADAVYTGKALEPEVTVTVDGTTLKKGSDYTVTYANNTNVGKGTATITFAGSYSGTATAEFNIKPAASSISLAAQSKTYNGKAQAYSGKVTKSGSAGAVSYAYYSDGKCTKAVAAANVKNAGTYYVKATVAASGNYAAATSAPAKLTIAKANNPLTVKAKKPAVKAGKSVAVSKALTIKKAQGAKAFAKKSGNKKITVNKKTGKITVKKGLKKGTYKVKIAVTAKGNGNYKAKTVAKVVKVKVK